MQRVAPRIGVFVCDCKGQVSDYIDTSHLAEKAADLEHVAFVDRRDLLCGERVLGETVGRLKDEGCDRMLTDEPAPPAVPDNAPGPSWSAAAQPGFRRQRTSRPPASM